MEGVIKMTKSITKGKMWCYAIGQLGWALLSGIIGSWLVYFYQPAENEVAAGMRLFIPQGRVIFGTLTIIGLITACGRLFDAVTDPLIGNWSDSCRAKQGRRIPFLKYAAVPFGIVTVLVFCAPLSRVSMLNTVWLFATVLLYYFLITCYCTPYTSLIAELAHTQEEKLAISTCISLTFIVGTAFAYLAPVVWTAFIGAGLERIFAMRLTFIIMAFAATICLLVPVFTINERDYCDAKPSDSAMLTSLLKTFKNKDFRVFVCQDVIYWLALTMFQTGLPFFVTVILKLPESYASPMFIGLTALSLLFYPAVNILAKKMGKKNLVLTAFAFFMSVFCFTGLCGPQLGISTKIQAALIVIVASFPMAIFGILPQTMVADVAQYETIKTGENRAGMFYAARTFAFKFGQSAAMLCFTSLATIGSASGAGYRIIAITASACCALGGIVLIKFNEKEILGTIALNEKAAD